MIKGLHSMIGSSNLTGVCCLVVASALSIADVASARAFAEAQHADAKSAISVTNEDPSFTISLPARYVSVKSVGDALYTFRTTDHSGALVAVYRLGHTVQPGALDVANFKDSDARRIPATWKARQLDAFAWHTTSKDGKTSAARWTQIPLEKEAVSVLVLVPTENEKDADGLLEDFLTRIDGPSNWPPPIQLTKTERAARVALGLGFLLAALAGPVVAVIALRRRRKTNPDRRPGRIASFAAELSSPDPRKLSYWLKVFAITFVVIAFVFAWLSLLTLGAAFVSEQGFGTSFQGMILVLNLLLIVALAAITPWLIGTVRRRGHVAVDLGPDRLRILFWTTAILCLTAASFNALAFLQSSNRSLGTIKQWNTMSLAAMMLAIVPQFVIRARGRIQLTDKGLFQNCSLLNWDKVNYARWLDASTKLQVKGTGPLSVTLPVSPEHKQAVDEVLAQHGVTLRPE